MNQAIISLVVQTINSGLLLKGFIISEIIWSKKLIDDTYRRSPVLSDWLNLSAMSASPQGHQAWETTGISGNGVSLRALQVGAVQVHILIGVTGTSALLRREPFSIWPWHPDLTGGYLYDVAFFGLFLQTFPVFSNFVTYVRLMPFPSLIRKRKASTEASSEGYSFPLGGGFVKFCNTL